MVSICVTLSLRGDLPRSWVISPETDDHSSTFHGYDITARRVNIIERAALTLNNVKGVTVQAAEKR